MNFNIRHKLNEGYSIGGIADAYHSPRNERLEGSYVSKSNGSSVARAMFIYYYWDKKEIIIPSAPKKPRIDSFGI